MLHIFEINDKDPKQTSSKVILMSLLKLNKLNHFRSIFHFHTPRKQNTYGFQIFSGGIEMEDCPGLD